MAGYSVTYTVVDNATKQIDAINRRIQQMRAPIDRLSRQVSRFVDVSGLGKVAKGFESIFKAAGSVLRTLSAIVPVMGAITGAASIAGMVKLVQSYASWAHELVATADNIGITTQQLQQFQDATRLAGGNAGDMTEGLKSLHDAVSDINIGRGGFAQSIQMFNYLGINIRDATGRMRSAADLMPEVIAKIGALKDPADRARIAAGLLGGEGDRLVETFRQSSRSFGQWFADVQRYKDLTDAQKQSLQRFSEAQGRLGVTFDRLAAQLAVVLTKNLTPLMEHFAEFVDKHTPEIIAAVDQLSAKFAEWLEGIKWSDVEDAIDKLVGGLKLVMNNLDTIKEVAEAIAVAFAIKWGVGIIANIAAVTGALGPLNAALLPIVAALGLITAYERNKAGQQEIEDKAKGMGFDKQAGGLLGMPTFKNPKTGEDLSYGDMMKRQGREAGGGGWLERGLGALKDRVLGGPAAIQQAAPTGGPAAPSPIAGPAAPSPIAGPAAPSPTGGPPPSNLNLPTNTVQRGAAINARLASDLGLTTAQSAGIVGNLQAESGLKAVQERNPLGGGRGGFGWAQWTGPRRVEFEKYAKDNKLDPTSDEANYGFLLKELHGAGNAKMLEQLRQLNGPDAAKQAAALVERQYERPAVSNAGVRGGYAEQIASATPQAVATAAAPSVAVPPPQPLNGSVDVSITHKNPPPDSAVTASGNGAVNVAPVRVEHQDMASI